MNIKKICKRLKIRLTVKRGKKRIPKSKKVLIKQIKNKLKLQKTKFGVSGAGIKKHFKKNWKKYGALAIAAGAIGGGHYYATRTEGGKKRFTGYNKMVGPTSGKKENHENKENHEKLTEIQKIRKEEDNLRSQELKTLTPEQQIAHRKESLEIEQRRRREDQDEIQRKKDEELEKKREESEKKGAWDHYVNTVTFIADVQQGNRPELVPIKLLYDQGKQMYNEHQKEKEEKEKAILSAQEEVNNATDPSVKKIAQDKLDTLTGAKQALEEQQEKIMRTADGLNNLVTQKGLLKSDQLCSAEWNRIENQIIKFEDQLDDLTKSEDPEKRMKQLEKRRKTLTDSLEEFKDKEDCKPTVKKINKKIEDITEEITQLLGPGEGSHQLDFGRRSKFGNIRKRINITWKITKQKFYQISKIIASGVLSGIGIFTGVTISLYTLFKYFEYRKTKLDPMFAARLFKATDSKGQLHVDKFMNSIKRSFDTHSGYFVSKFAQEIRKETPGIVQEGVTSGINVIQANSMTLMMPMMMALSTYFSKQMSDLTVASAKKNRSESGKKGWETRRRKMEETKAATKIQKNFRAYNSRKKTNKYKTHLQEHSQIDPRELKLNVLHNLRNIHRVHRFGKRF